MNWMSILQQVFEVCIIPLLGILTVYLISIIKKKANEIAVKTDSELTQKYVYMLSDTISSCVLATNQTYVESLKKRGIFDIEAQKIAFKMTLDAVLSVLSDEAKKYLQSAYGDLNVYLTKQIEATVNQNKTEIKEN